MKRTFQTDPKKIADIVNRISELRTKKGLSARDVSMSAGLNGSYINGLETRRNFLPSMEAMLSIIEAMGSTPMEFFYYSISAFEQDKELIQLLKSATPERKQAAISVLKLK